MSGARGDDRIHHYVIESAWSGSTASGYESYDRSHRVSSALASSELEITADPAFRGEVAKWNPEQLVVAAASSCQLLSFLALAARARIDVRSYEDFAEATMDESEHPIRLNSILLRPKITVGPDTNSARVQHLVEVAHRECFIANSLSTPIAIELSIIVDPGAAR